MATNKMSSSLSFNIPRALPSVPQCKFHPLSTPFNKKQPHVSKPHKYSVSLSIILTKHTKLLIISVRLIHSYKMVLQNIAYCFFRVITETRSCQFEEE